MELLIDKSKLTLETLGAWGRQFPKAAASGLNRTATQARTKSSELTRAQYNIRKSDLDKNIRIRRATDKNLQASLRITGRRPPLIQFGGRGSIPSKPGTVGASVEVTKGRRLMVAGSFMAIMKSGHKGIFIRKGPERLPIRELTGPSVPQMFFGAKVFRPLEAFVRAKIVENVTNAINFLRR